METDPTTSFANPELVEKLKEGNFQFALNLYRKCVEGTGDENMFLSPFSITAALAMTFAGSRGDTQSEMKEVMGLDQFEDLESTYTAFDDVLKSIDNACQTGLKLNSANGLYAHVNYDILQEYKSLLQKYFRVLIHSVDFVNESEKVRGDINSFVEDVTNNRIKDLIAPGAIKADTRLVLVNAIYFKGDWLKKFDEKYTGKREFRVSSSKSIHVDMMIKKSKYEYAECEKLQCQLLHLKYAGERLGMYFLLPREVDGLAALEEKLDYASFTKLVESAYETDVNVSIPRFKIESSFDLGTPLGEIGMTKMFSQGVADFTGITTTEPLCVSAVVHKAFLEVNEEGSEAAAATAVMMVRYCLMPEFSFYADHPFLVLIRDNHSGLILFMGRVASPDPSEK